MAKQFDPADKDGCYRLNLAQRSSNRTGDNL